MGQQYAFVEVGQLMIAGLLIALLAFGRDAVRRGALVGGCGAVLAVALAKALEAVVFRARPFVAEPALVRVQPPHGPDASFPSDSATAAFAAAAALHAYAPRWGRVAFALAGALAIGRVAVGMHYPTDVLAGAALGGCVAAGLRTGMARRHLEALSDAWGHRRSAVLSALTRH